MSGRSFEVGDLLNLSFKISFTDDAVGEKARRSGFGREVEESLAKKGKKDNRNVNWFYFIPSTIHSSTIATVNENAARVGTYGTLFGAGTSISIELKAKTR